MEKETFIENYVIHNGHSCLNKNLVIKEAKEYAELLGDDIFYNDDIIDIKGVLLSICEVLKTNFNIEFDMDSQTYKKKRTWMLHNFDN